MFTVILLSAFTIAHVYVLWRAASLPALKRRLTRKSVVVGGVLLWSLFLTGFMYGHDNSGAFASLVELAGMTWLGMLLLCMVTLLAVDAATGFGVLVPGFAPSLRGAALVCGLALSIIASVQGTRPPAVRTYEIELRGLPAEQDGMVIIALSDLHIGAVLDGKWLAQRVAQVLAERPALIVLLGDIFEGHGRPSSGLIPVLRELQAPLGVWAVLGNHEMHGKEEPVVSLMKEAGIRVLRNERASIRPGLMLAGVDDLTMNYRSGSDRDLVSRTLAPSRTDATVLLSHTPWDADRAAQSAARLMLCGHTHGGQLWPFGYPVRLFYPLLAGRYDVGGMPVIVSRGAGTWGPRMRLWQPGEITRVVLRAKKDV